MDTNVEEQKTKRKKGGFDSYHGTVGRARGWGKESSTRDTHGDSVLGIQQSVNNPTVRSIKQVTNIDVRCKSWCRDMGSRRGGRETDATMDE